MSRFAKPENVLKRAEELVSVGQSAAALQSLHELITSKRVKSAPIASLEPMMLRLVELSVEQRKGKIAKEGLYQYKNIAQNTSVETLVVVVNKFIELSESKFQEAQAAADKISLETIDDLEAIETPESILLSTVSSDVSKDRTDRAVVTPWLKFLWETYRTVLDILRNNGRLELSYQKVAIQALDFCQKYARKTEFRRLCDLLRNHLQNAAKYQNQPHGINLNDADTLQRHLDTRFTQLNSAVTMELWQEAFRSVEDIHNLLTISKRPPKPAVMANYYEKLSKIFLVSGNYLFHAAAFNKYATLVRTQNKNATEAELERLGSIALLSALAIPVLKENRGRGVAQDLDDNKGKNNRLAALLNMSSAPTRASLLKEALHKNARAKTVIRDIHAALETSFQPLSICSTVSPLMEQLASDEESTQYVAPLQQVILARTFKQLSQVYETVSLDFVIGLCKFPEPFTLSEPEIEKFIMTGCKKGELTMRIDHSNNAITFESDMLEPISSVSANTGEIKVQATPSELVRSQLTRLAKCLYSTLTHVDPAFCEEKRALKKAAIERAAANTEQEHQDILARTQIIERRKELVQGLQLKKDQEEATKREILRQREAEAETKRIAEETRRRELERIKREQEKIKADESKKLIAELKAAGGLGDIDDKELEGLDTTKLRAMQLEQLEKSSKDINERMRITAKKIDHLERAFRRAEMPLVQKDAEEQARLDRANFADSQTATQELARSKHAADMVLKKRMSRIMPDFNEYRQKLADKRDKAYEARLAVAQKKLEEAKQQRRDQYRAQREEEDRLEREQDEADRLAYEEELKAEEARQQEAAEREKAEAERAAKAEEEKAARAEQQKKLDDQARVQREREEAAEAKLRAKREERNNPAPAAAAPPAGGDRPGVYRPGQGKWSSQSRGAAPDARPSSSGGYGDRDVGRASPFGAARPRDGPPRDAPVRTASGSGRDVPPRSTGESPAPGADGKAPAATTGKYVPRHLRGDPQAGADGARRGGGW
ncbi:Eukaryotic translation initiation factor 3 subunit A [Taphrina deformans PYCC 5710]|uniref:Eukaryotic translation initiation factor 3 subunit A n=1 Tax=Taphrina deformans (strain PYCC 5710 / ATCC 11124 / CBS 356.35 / IMI 108563 / JCM 9778 / NBRC 8474) TaxID=1097556 RepID=R4X8X8_TAPDE|nr:Eukaryotic translation initiation factor 3 subunit A [Taphrina deformans PYCC 5710]|eukprot:CCG80597.1 Eukaryotic translation initiation factor 3 subunit A [Taphrina deformans PYCC 5710]